MTRKLSADAEAAARSVLDSVTSEPSPCIPGVVYCAVDKNGEIIFSHASGKTGLTEKTEMSTDSIFWMASCTKLITSIACMQLVEQDKLSLDDADQIISLAPELGKVQVLERDGKNGFRFVPKERKITLRMLLNHTSGFGYAFEDLKLRDWSRPIGIDDFSGNETDVLHGPLVNQPGTKFQYGVGVDWAGTLVERITGLCLEDYFRTHILGPLGIENITFFPNETMKSRMAYMHQRAKDGTLSVRDHLYRYPLLLNRHESHRFCMGGAGCFGKPIEYCRILATMLNGGLSPNTGARILNAETVNEMFKDQIPDMPRYCNEVTPSAKPELANPCPLVPCADDLTEGWGLSFSISHTKSPTGRAAGSASWEGLANLFWFADRENGIGGIIASQILPYGAIADSKFIHRFKLSSFALWNNVRLLWLKGKTAIVTGSSRGIGAGIALQLARRGANVVVNYVSDSSKERAQKVVDQITEIGTKAILCRASVMNLDEIPRLIEAALQISESGKIEILVHNAALGLEANLEDTSLELYTTHFDCNVRGPIFLTKAALPHLARGGRIVFVSSAAARLGVAGHTVYGPTKAANEALARVWAKELGHSHGITVNSVNPGPVATDQWFQSDPQFIKDMEPMIKETPAAPRVGEVEDIAPLVAFLCSEDARWTTGSTLCANGGLYN